MRRAAGGGGQRFQLAGRILCAGVVWAMIVLYTAYFSTFAMRLYDNLLMKALDLGNMDQAVWQTAHGRPFYFTNMELPLHIEAFGTTSRLSFHVEPILLVVAALYRVVAGPAVLLVGQALVVALGALPLSWLARDLLRNRIAQVAVPLAYLAHPMLQSATLDEFHPVTLAPTFLLFAAYFAWRRSYLWFAVSAALAIGCKEEIGLLVGSMSLALAIRRRHEPAARAVGVATALAAVSWSAVALGAIIPRANHGAPSPYWARLISATPLPAGPTSPWGVLRLWRLHPSRLVATIMMPAKAQFAWHYLAPAGLLALLGLDVLLVALPSLILIAVTREFHMFAGIGHYTAEIVPFAFLSALVGTRRLARVLLVCVRLPEAAGVAACCVVVLAAALACQVRWGYTPLRAGMGPPPLSAHGRVAARMLELIPAGAAVSAQEGLGPHLGERPAVYLFPDLGPHHDAAFIALDVAGDAFPQNPIDLPGEVRRLLASGQWGVRFAEDGLLLLQRGRRHTAIPPAFLRFLDLRQGGSPRPPLARFGGVLDLIDYRIVYRPLRYLGYPVLEVATRWRVRAKVPADLRLTNAITADDGTIAATWTDFAATDWFPPSLWRPGQTFWVPMHAAVLPLDTRGKVDVWLTVFVGAAREATNPRRRLTVLLPPTGPGGPRRAVGGTLLHLASVDAGS